MGKSMKNKFLVLAVVLTLVTSLVIAGCVPAPTPVTPPVTPPPVTPPVTPPVEPVEPPEPLVIGASLAMTGLYAMYMADIVSIMPVYADYINAQGGIHGRPVEFIMYDNESTVELAATQTAKLIEEDECHVVISSLFTTIIWPQYEAAKGTGVPFIIMVGGPEPPEFYIPGSNIFGVHHPYDYFGHATAVYMFEDLGCTKFAYLSTDDASGEEDLAWMLESAEELGIEVAIIEYCGPDAIDVTAQLTRIKAKVDAGEADALQLAGSGIVVGPMWKGIKLLGLDEQIPVACATGMVAIETIGLVTGYELETLIMPMMPMQAGGLPVLSADHPLMVEVDEMWAVWSDKFGETRGTREEFGMGWACFGWDTMEMAVEGLKQADPDLLLEDLATAREAVRWSLENEMDYMTSWGWRTTSPTDHIGIPKAVFCLITIKNDQFELLKLLE